MQISIEHLSKSFGPVRVLTDLNLTIRPGEVVALMGENGAGKSTLMKILSGVYPHGQYEGEFTLDGMPARFKSPKDAESCGIAIIHQELSFFSHLTVAENLFVGRWPQSRGCINWAHLETEAKAALLRVGAEEQPNTLMKDLRVGEQQLVEIAKALHRKSQILILDEPTSALSPRECERLFELMSELKRQGVGLVYISHKMDEIYRVADRIVVLRDGQIVGDAPTQDWSREDLIKKMVGRDMSTLFPQHKSFCEDKVVLKAEQLRVRHGQKNILGPLSFEIRRGEILGLAGLMGAGRTELMKALYGDTRYETGGRLELNGKSWRPSQPKISLAQKMFYLSEDRKRESLLKNRSLEENLRVSALSLKDLFTPLRDTVEVKMTDDRLQSLRVRYHERDQNILELSGGNQQKVVLGRCLEIGPDLILLDEPTRGVDVGAKFEIYQLLFELARQGKSILLASSEMIELMGLCDRILVLRQGQSMGILKRGEWSAESIGAMAFGEVVA